MSKYDEFGEYEKKDLIALLDSAWIKFRKILSFLTKNNQ